MPETIRGYCLRDSAGLEHWNDLLEEWLRAHERFCRIRSGDPAYQYTERPNVGVLGAAAWNCGMVALQEFRTKKEVRDGEAWVGRADLLICTDTDRTEYLIEAKHEWVPLFAGPDKWITTIEASMDDATGDAKNAGADQPNATAIAVVFASLHASPQSDTDQFDERIEDFCETVKASEDYHASAWYFPQENRTLPAGDNYYYPGIAMLVKKHLVNQ